MNHRKSVLGMLAAALLLASLPCWAAEVADSAGEIQPLLVGSPIPSVQLRNDSGQEVDLQKVVAEKPSILIFYRGGW